MPISHSFLGKLLEPTLLQPTKMIVIQVYNNVFTSTGEGKCAKRNLDFKHRDHYTFTANNNKKKAIKALKGSDEVLKGRKGDTIWLQLRCKN